MGKLFNLRPPRIRITSKGVKITRPSASIGGKKTRVNLSSKGVSGTVGSTAGSYNTRRGCSLNIFSWLFGRKRK